MKFRLLEIGKDVKAKKAKARREKVKELMGIDLAETGTCVKLQLIQDLIPLALIHVGEVLQEEVRSLAGQMILHIRLTAQILNYLKATEIQVGLLVNFKHPRVEIKRMILGLKE